MSSAAPFIRPTVFLDTNALHYMSTYLMHAKEYKLPPYAQTPGSYDEVQATLERYLPKRLARYVMNGCRTLAYLEDPEGEPEGVEVYTSRLSKLEVLFGVLDGQAHAQMACAGMPYRMRQRGRNLSELVEMYLKPGIHEMLAKELESMFCELKSRIGVVIRFAEGNQLNLQAIIGFAELLQKKVFLEVIDCWMYGCGLTVQADHIFTFDEYFRITVNRIHDPPHRNEHWLGLQRAVLDELEKSLSGVSTAVELSLPKAIGKLSKRVPRPW